MVRKGSDTGEKECLGFLKMICFNKQGVSERDCNLAPLPYLIPFDSDGFSLSMLVN